MKNLKRYSSVTTVTIIVVLMSCNQEGKVEERNKATLVKAHDELFAKGNLSFADEVFADNYAGGGPDLIKGFIKDRREAFPDLQYNLEHIVAKSNMTAWIRTNTGTHSKDYLGFRATGKKVTWKEMAITRYDENSKVAEEWWVSDAIEKFSNASGIEGVYEYLSPDKGQAVNRNGQFVYLFGSADGKRPMVSNAGTYEVSGEIMKNTIKYAIDPKQMGTSFWWKAKSWSGDTLTYETMNEKGERTGGGRALKVSN